ncbi:YebO family protein [Erwinia amylovora]|uniref:Uncharacterized n=4 Tax=Erwinia amylovora TaxID=552 RepID=A0A831A220_ERWAM|nr:YebO family protein [Erwinia amylovora]CBX80894.1 Uncharacterized protein YPO1740/y2567/YP_1481 [Erwinia amylovora ATCC BAA-2158]CDK15482.1 hypothetical protein LA635_1858 [Erwinia amylovora LA635]CDK18849.1 hypothetical protein LA636_1857 [Erwinia amylovora LA636]CDK22219.1 hypothetical protein LA637_1859 [Erwinia amylovora LA637]ATZ11774.1 hypothetical protein AD997_10005 [Erwinia amylovora]
MNELTSGATGLAATGIIAIMVIASLVAWFFVNRVSVRANQQIQLLESLLAEQKRQNLLLHRLTDALTSAEQDAKGGVSDVNEDYTRLIPER